MVYYTQFELLKASTSITFMQHINIKVNKYILCEDSLKKESHALFRTNL